jgi:hypothetical protein
MHEDWISLRRVEGDILRDSLWAEAISTLPNLKEIRLESDEIRNSNIINFCNLCKDKPICETLKVWYFSADDLGMCTDGYEHHRKKITDGGLYALLDTFLNMSAITFHNTKITLTKTNIVQN